jgi:hypothetical protein
MKSIYPSLSQSWPFDGRPGFVNNGFTPVTVRVNGEIVPDAVAVSPKTGHVLSLIRNDSNDVVSHSQPCACACNLHWINEDGSFCLPFHLMQGHVSMDPG